MQTKKLKHVLFVIRSTSHLAYYQSIIEKLCQNNLKVTLLFNKNWSDKNNLQEVNKLVSKYNNLNWRWSFIRSDLFRLPLFSLREIASYRKYLQIKGQSPYYTERWRKYMTFPFPYIAKLSFFNNLLKTKIISYFLNHYEKMIPPDSLILKQLIKENIDIVIAGPANMRFSEEIEYIKAAKRLKIPTIIPVISWDNLTTKGLIHIKPDNLFVWNNTQLKEAIKHHQIKKSNIEIIGASFFDKWFNSSNLLIPKEKFYRQYNLNSKSKQLLYLGSSANIAQDETWIIKEIRDYFDKSKKTEISNLEIIVRPHPANFEIYKKINHPKIKILPLNGSLPNTESDKKLFYNCIYYSIAVLGINTSGMIDSIIMDKPTISYITNTYKNTQTNAQHFKQLLENNVLELASSPSNLSNILQKIINGNDSKKRQRKIFIQQFIRPFGINISAAQKAFDNISYILKTNDK